MDALNTTALDIEAIRADFPILQQQVKGKPLVYLDNAATTQKPEAVLAAEDRWYRELCSNVHRGVHDLSQKATDCLRVSTDAWPSCRSTSFRRCSCLLRSGVGGKCMKLRLVLASGRVDPRGSADSGGHGFSEAAAPAAG